MMNKDQKSNNDNSDPKNSLGNPLKEVQTLKPKLRTKTFSLHPKGIRCDAVIANKGSNDHNKKGSNS